MKKLLLTQRLVRAETSGEVRDCLDTAWARLALALGWLPVPFPSGVPAREFLLGNPCDALVLTGGNDLAAVSGDPLSARRDAAEKDLLSAFLSLGLPVVGVCRGMQLIGDAFGMGLRRVEGHAGTRCRIAPAGESRHRAALAALADVNAYHDWALDGVRGPFLLSAASPDGVPKAMEWPGRRVWAQMWHSERETPFAAAELAILKSALED